jgi:hypothetical protein
MQKTNYIQIGLIVFLSVLWSGCASFQATIEPVSSPPITTKLPSAELNWWTVAFKWNWPEGEKAAWHLDTLLAHKIIFPILKSESEAIHLWRIHRRANRDSSGHRFRFLFYSTQIDAEKIYQLIAQNTLLQDLQSANKVMKVDFDDINKLSNPYLEDTSDAKWSPLMQKTWPFFIMGVCEMWINMIDIKVASHRSEYQFDNFEDTIKFYADIEAVLRNHLRTEGGHALLHHLSGIFGYTEIVIRERRSIKF